jgi:hypothetical protein
MFYDVYATQNWHVNDVTISPFEQRQTFLIGNRNGGLSFIDFGDTSKKRRLLHL